MEVFVNFVCGWRGWRRGSAVIYSHRVQIMGYAPGENILPHCPIYVLTLEMVPYLSPRVSLLLPVGVFTPTGSKIFHFTTACTLLQFYRQ